MMKVAIVYKKCTGFERTFEGSNLRMLSARFEMFILHYIMEYIGNLCSQKGEFIIIGHTRLLLHVCLMALL